ncbi:MAG TPA: hypothetical protein VFU13_19735 [Steroidobacteraceae bacterium]|nr:hypothetical protein [Steroidobacteraceae bacterium]
MKRRGFTAFHATVLMSVAMQVMAHDPKAESCDASSPAVALELAVLRSPAIPVTAVSGEEVQLPVLVLDKHYAINLIAQSKVVFRVKPARAARDDSSRGGVLRFAVPAAGRYRISITSQHWIDVLDGKSAVTSAAHHGPGCELLHKIVEFDLPAARPLTLQLSGRDDAIIGLAITLSPDAPGHDPT